MIPDWFLIAILVYFLLDLVSKWRIESIIKVILKLEQERFIYEKNTNQYSKAIVDASRIANSPKHSRR
jgi:hypothetical protein